MYHIISDNYENSISFITPDNRVQRFRVGGQSELACRLAGVYYFSLAVADSNVSENYSSPYSQPQINTSPMMSGIGICNVLPRLRTRVVTYKLLIISPSNIWSGDNQTWKIGRGAKERVRDFIRDFLDCGDVTVQYGTWGGIDLGGYLVDEPQVSYNKTETQATLTFTLQFVNPITLHPNFTNSRLWSSETEQIDWSTLTNADNGNLRAVTATRDTTDGTLSATFTNIKRWSNVGFVCTTGTSKALNGALTISKSSIVIGKRKTAISLFTNRISIYTMPKSYYINTTAINNATNLNNWSNASGGGVGVSAVPPWITCTVSFTPDNATDTDGASGKFILLGW